MSTHILPGAAEDMAHSSLRFGIGRFTTEAEIDFVVDRIVKTVDRLREMRYVPKNALPPETNYPPALYGRWFKRELISIRLIGLNTKGNRISAHYALPILSLH